MNKRLIRISITLLAVILIGLGVTWIANGSARAALGNQGIPVRCYISGTMAPGTTQFLTCVSAAPPGFVGSQRVPDGYYFLVTDILVTPSGGTTGNAPVDFYLFDAYGTSSRASLIHFRSVDGATYGEHFTAPMYVLSADHRLEVQAFNANATSFDIRVNGLLTTNVDYLPMVLNNP